MLFLKHTVHACILLNYGVHCTCLSRTMNRLKVAYNDSLRMVLGIPRYCSASEMFAYTNVPSCQCVIRLNIYSFVKRIQCMNNEIVHSIVHSDLIFSSLLWLNWRRRLFYVSNSTNCIVLIAFVLCSCLWNAQWSESEIKYYISIYIVYTR